MIPTIPVFDREASRQLSEFVKFENVRGHLMAHQRANAVEILYTYLLHQKNLGATPFSDRDTTGSRYILSHIATALEQFKNTNAGTKSEADDLDF